MATKWKYSFIFAAGKPDRPVIIDRETGDHVAKLSRCGKDWQERDRRGHLIASANELQSALAQLLLASGHAVTPQLLNAQEVARKALDLSNGKEITS